MNRKEFNDNYSNAKPRLDHIPDGAFRDLAVGDKRTALTGWIRDLIEHYHTQENDIYALIGTGMRCLNLCQPAHKRAIFGTDDSEEILMEVLLHVQNITQGVHTEEPENKIAQMVAVANMEYESELSNDQSEQNDSLNQGLPNSETSPRVNLIVPNILILAPGGPQ